MTFHQMPDLCQKDGPHRQQEGSGPEGDEIKKKKRIGVSEKENKPKWHSWHPGQKDHKGYT